MGNAKTFPTGLADGTTVTSGNSSTGGQSAMAIVIGTGASLVASTSNTFDSQGNAGEVWHLINGTTITTAIYNSLNETSLACKTTYQWSGAAMPGVLQRIIDVRLAGGTGWRVMVNTSNQPFLQDSTGTTIWTGSALSAGVEYRFETAGSVSNGSAVIKLDYYVGNSATHVEAGYSTTSGNTTNSGANTGNITNIIFIQGSTPSGGSWGADVGGFQYAGGTTTYIGPVAGSSTQTIVGAAATPGLSIGRGGQVAVTFNGTPTFALATGRPATVSIGNPTTINVIGTPSGPGIATGRPGSITGLSGSIQPPAPTTHGDSLRLGPLELLGNTGDVFRLDIGEHDFGDPQAVTEAIRSQLTNGSFVTGDFTDNRTIPLHVQIRAVDRITLSAAHEALLTQVNQRFNTLLWTPADGLQLAFETFRGQAQTTWDGRLENFFIRRVTITLSALPFGRSTTRTTIAGQSNSIQLANFATPYPYKTVPANTSFPGDDPRGNYTLPTPTVVGNAYGPQTVPPPIAGMSASMRMDINFYTYGFSVSPPTFGGVGGGVLGGGSGGSPGATYTYYNAEGQIANQPINPAVAVASVGAQASGAATSLAVAYPMIVAGQVLVLAVTSATAGAATVTTPTGWTVLQAEPGASGKPGVYTFWKRATGTETGTLTVTFSTGTPTWNATIMAIASARKTGNPYAHEIGAASSSTVTTVTTSSLTVDTTALTGRRFAIAIVQGAGTGSGIWSAETWASLTGATATELQDANGTLIACASSTGGTASTFTAAAASMAGYAYVAFDIVEAPSADLSANTAITFAVYVGTDGNTASPYYDWVAAWLTLVDVNNAVDHFHMAGPAPGQSGFFATAGWQYLTCSIADTAIDLTQVKTWTIDLNAGDQSYNPGGPNTYFLGVLEAFPTSSVLTSTANGTVVRIPNVPGSAQAPASIELDRGGAGPQTAELIYRAPSGTLATTPMLVPGPISPSTGLPTGTTPAPSTFAGTYRLLVAAASPSPANITITQNVNGSAKASLTLSSWTAVGAHFVDFGDITLPLVDIPSSVGALTYTVTISSPSSPVDFLFCDTRGFLIWVPNFAAANYLWIDEATVSSAGGVYAGNNVDRSDAVSLLGGVGVQTNGAMSVDPGDNYLMAWCPDGAPSDIAVSFYPRYIGERTGA